MRNEGQLEVCWSAPHAHTTVRECARIQNHAGTCNRAHRHTCLVTHLSLRNDAHARLGQLVLAACGIEIRAVLRTATRRKSECTDALQSWCAAYEPGTRFECTDSDSFAIPNLACAAILVTRRQVRLTKQCQFLWAHLRCMGLTKSTRLFPVV